MNAERVQEIAEFVLELPRRRVFMADKELLNKSYEYLEELVADEIVIVAARRAAEAKDAELAAERTVASAESVAQPLLVAEDAAAPLASMPEPMPSELSVDAGKAAASPAPESIESQR